LSYIRKSEHDFAIGLFNFTPVPRENYRIGVPEAGEYRIVVNSDSEFYGGSNFDTATVIQSEEMPCSDKPFSIALDLPPLSGLIIQKA
jgi:1,4-alpha-glucan branching enzyme